MVGPRSFEGWKSAGLRSSPAGSHHPNGYPSGTRRNAPLPTAPAASPNISPGSALFGSIALVADGLHMSTHAGALLLAALAYTYARKHINDPRFTFGTGKLGDLAGFTSAVILA
jgi:Cation efflux family